MPIPGGGCRGGSAGGNGNGLSSCAERKVAAGEVIERALVFEEDNHAVCLTTQLQSNGQLRHGAVADVLATDEDPTTASSATYPDTGPTHSREYGVTVTVIEKIAALAGVSEYLDGLLKTVCPSASERCGEQQKDQNGC